MGVTVSDIANKATVSVGTVSRVLNNEPNVGPKHKQRVLSAMAELNYRPNPWARGIRKKSASQQTGQIALLFFNIPDFMLHAPYVMQYIQGVQQEIDAASQKCLFSMWQETDDVIPQILLDGQVDGVVFKGEPHGPMLRKWLSRYPTVSLNPRIETVDCDCVRVDYAKGLRDIVAYLAERGHRRVAIVGADKSGYVRHKLSGYRQAIKELGLDADEELIQIRDALPEITDPKVPPGTPDFSWAIENLWSLPQPPTAIVSSDCFCVGIYKLLTGRGLKVPQDVSVLGYDNEVRFCEALTPPLTSVDLRATNIGRIAVRQLHNRIKNPREPYHKIFIPGQIVERASVRKL